MCETIFRSYYAGPFNFETGETKGSLPKLHYWMSNSWSKVSNIIYLDSPAGVGFSYSGNKSDYITLHESHNFIICFLLKHYIYFLATEFGNSLVLVYRLQYYRDYFTKKWFPIKSCSFLEHTKIDFPETNHIIFHAEEKTCF